MRPLVVLRPEPGATATCEAARSAGLHPISIPLFRIEPVEWQAPDPHRFDALLLTSGNAARHGGSELSRLRSLPAHVVGEATAAAASEQGLRVETVGSGGVDDLLGKLDPELRLLHLCGEHRREPRRSVTPIVVYRSAAMPPPQELRVIEGAVVAVHSPRAGRRLAEVSGEVDRSRTCIAAISDEAASVAGEGWERVEAAAEPNDLALLALAARLCDNSAG